MGTAASILENLDASGLEIAVVVSRYNETICEGLLQGALRGLKIMGLSQGEVAIHHVPGAFELPLTAKLLAENSKMDAVICLGAVIRGDTAHFDYVCDGVTLGLQQAMLQTGVPMAFGVLTTDNQEQAVIRSAGDENNKGLEAARTAVEMAILAKKFKG